MLLNLNIKDFILIDRLDLDFDKGFVVITGETGAGKSILLDAVLFALGNKVGNNLVKKGADYCSVTLIFSENQSVNSHLAEIGIESSEEIVIKAVQTIAGRKKFFINDQIVTGKIIGNLSGYLLELYGQHHQTTLTDASSHLAILDQYAETKSLLIQVKNYYKAWQDIVKEIQLFQKEAENIEKEIDYLSHVSKELELLDIKEGEEEKLADIRQKLQGRDKEVNLITTILTDIENTSIDQLVSRSQRNLAKLTEKVELELAHTSFDEVYDKIEQIKTSLKDYLNNFEEAEYTLESIEDRLYEIRNMARKHSCQPTDLMKLQEQTILALNLLHSRVANKDDLEKNVKIAKDNYYKTAKQLSIIRQKSATDLEEKAMSELNQLEMKSAIFKIEFKSLDEKEGGVSGIDRVKFTASTNPGMPLSPINEVASGGELSRFMLALRSALFDKSNKQTIIFDEIDVGISGSVTDSVGVHLKKLSKAVQVIVITHQPQIAGKADQHVLVSKTQYQDYTKVEINTLSHDAKSLELARMISGKKITKAGVEAAKELLL